MRTVRAADLQGLALTSGAPKPCSLSVWSQPHSTTSSQRRHQHSASSSSAGTSCRRPQSGLQRSPHLCRPTEPNRRAKTHKSGPSCARRVFAVMQHALLAARTFIAAAAPPDSRVRVLSYMSVFNSAGFALGPALGGALSYWGIRTTAWAATIASVLSIVAVAIIVPGITHTHRHTHTHTAPDTHTHTRARARVLHGQEPKMGSLTSLTSVQHVCVCVSMCVCAGQQRKPARHSRSPEDMEEQTHTHSHTPTHHSHHLHDSDSEESDSSQSKDKARKVSWLQALQVRTCAAHILVHAYAPRSFLSFVRTLLSTALACFIMDMIGSSSQTNHRYLCTRRPRVTGTSLPCYFTEAGDDAHYETCQGLFLPLSVAAILSLVCPGVPC